MTTSSHCDRGMLLAVALTAVLAYAATLTYDFVWDDIILIHNRLHMYTVANLPRLFLSDFFSDGATGESSFFRPFIALSFFLDLKLWGLTPAGFHLTNVLAHALVSLGVLRLAARVTGSAVGALSAGLLFAIHPVHSESVAFISGRTDVFATLFVLVAVLAHVNARQTAARGWRALSILAYVLALLSKEVAVVLPVLLLLYDVAIRGEPTRRAEWRRAALRYAPYALVLIAYVGLRRAALAAGREPTLPWADSVTRVLTTVKMAAWYAWPGLLPYPTILDYDVPLDHVPPRAVWWVVFVALAVLMILTIGLLRRAPAAGFGAAWFWIALGPMVGGSLLPVQRPLMADRFLYLPAVGLALLVGAIIARHAPSDLSQIRLRPGAAVCVVVVTATYAVLTLWRNEDWHDPLRLARRVVETSPEAPLPRLNLALTQISQGEIRAARANLEIAARRAPDHPLVLVALGFTETFLGDREPGLRHPQRAYELAPDTPGVLNLLAEVYGRRGELDHAMAMLERSLRINPNQVAPTMTLGLVQHMLDRDEAALATVERGHALNDRAHQADLIVEKATAEICRA